MSFWGQETWVKEEGNKTTRLDGDRTFRYESGVYLHTPKRTVENNTNNTKRKSCLLYPQRSTVHVNTLFTNKRL